MSSRHLFSTIDTPAVLIDLTIARKNITRVQVEMDRLGRKNRPHIKTHKLARLAKYQIEAGAIGITCQKIGEAEIMAAAGVEDIFISYNIIGKQKTERLVALGTRCDLSVSADSQTAVEGLATAFHGHARKLPVLVECDTGHGRCGVQNCEEVVALAREIASRDGLEFGGLMTYPPMVDMANVNAWLARAKDKLQEEGLACHIISVGGTPNLGQLDKLEIATEHRPGTYVYNDRSLIEHGLCSTEDCALNILATVVSRPTQTRAIIDAGSKILTSDLLGLDGYGLIVGAPEARLDLLSEEHGHVSLSADGWQPNIGDQIRIIPNHACVVSNMVEKVHLIADGEIEAVRVDARGCIN